MVKQDDVIGNYRRAETNTGLSFELALVLHGVFANFYLNS